jgi:hypothetical protein
LFKRELEALYGNNTLNIDFMSCEMLAEELIGYISEKYPNRDMVVKVYEDDENGAILQYTAPVRFEENMK